MGASSGGLCHSPGAPRALAPSVSLLSILPTHMPPPHTHNRHMAPTPRPPGSQREATMPPRAHLAMSGGRQFWLLQLGGDGAPPGSSSGGQGSAQHGPHHRGVGPMTVRGGCPRAVRLTFPDVRRGLPARCGHQHACRCGGTSSGHLGSHMEHRPDTDSLLH